MTEEEIKELARKYIDSCTKRAGVVILAEGIKSDFIDLFVAGFMKCLELNKEIKWHDLRKDPNDLPNGDRVVLNQVGMATRYDPNRGFLGLDGIGVIAWCEIPKVEETE